MGVVCLCIAAGVTAKKLLKPRKRQLLRSTKAQAKFSPVQTTYNPKQYRKER